MAVSCKIVRIKHKNVVSNLALSHFHGFSTVFCQFIMLKMSFLMYLMHTERAQLKLDASAVYTALGLNERLFICTSSQVEQLVRNRCSPCHFFVK